VDIKDPSMVIRGDRATMSEGKQTFEVEIRVNTAAKPKQIDTKNLGGREITMPRRKGLVMIENSVVSCPPPARVGRAGARGLSHAGA
jgi:hypothetical protein